MNAYAPPSYSDAVKAWKESTNSDYLRLTRGVDLLKRFPDEHSRTMEMFAQDRFIETLYPVHIMEMAHYLKVIGPDKSQADRKRILSWLDLCSPSGTTLAAACNINISTRDLSASTIIGLTHEWALSRWKKNTELKRYLNQVAGKCFELAVNKSEDEHLLDDVLQHSSPRHSFYRDGYALTLWSTAIINDRWMELNNTQGVLRKLIDWGVDINASNDGQVALRGAAGFIPDRNLGERAQRVVGDLLQAGAQWEHFQGRVDDQAWAFIEQHPAVRRTRLGALIAEIKADPTPASRPKI